MNVIKRSALLAATAALPFSLGSAAYANTGIGSDRAFADQDTPLDVDLDLNLDDTDDLRVGVRALTVNSDDDGNESQGAQETDSDAGSAGDEDAGSGDFNRIGLRSETSLQNLDEIDTDTRAVQQDENDGFSTRSILNIDDPDDIDTDIDVTFLDDNENSDGSGTGDTNSAADDVMADDAAGSEEESFEDDADYVFDN